jgi:hypothetical protein
MKSTLLKTTLLAVSVLGAVSSASAETVHAKIPFEFFVNGTAMPAGSYTVRTLTGTSPALVFENDLTKVQAIAFARTTGAGAATTASTFTVKTASTAYEVNLGAPTNPLKGVVLALTPAK